MKPTAFVVIALLGASACGPKQDAPVAAASGSPLAPPPTSGTAAAPAKAKTCAGGDAAACVAEARAIAPQGAYRVELSKADADAKEQATTKLAARACELGNGEGCALVARYGPFSDSSKKLERACELGYVPSCGSVGRQLADSGKKADLPRAAELLEKACDADAMDWMALTAHHGGFCRRLQELYTERLEDKAKAAKAHERACAQGDKLGCACKTDHDCGEVPDDQSGTYTCADGACDIMGG